jgi:hypothetical protein
MKESNEVANIAGVRRGRKDEKPDTTDGLHEAIIELCGAHGGAIIQQGTRILVAGELLSSITSHLPRQTRIDIAGTFRKRIERLLALGDDEGLPSTYMTELVSEVNRYLQVLDSE